MRIDEFDDTHQEFKKVILEHELTDEELELLTEIGFLAPIAANVGRFALTRALPAIGRGAMGALRGIGRGAGALAKGIGRGAGALARGGVIPGGGGGNNKTSNAISKAGDAVRDLATDLAMKNTGKAIKRNNNKNQQSLKKDTAAKLSQKGGGGPSQTIGKTVGTQGTKGTKKPGDQLKRGDTLNLPIPDPNNPAGTKDAEVKVKSVSGSEIEFQPQKKAPGLPKSVKYNKKDLQFQ